MYRLLPDVEMSAQTRTRRGLSTIVGDAAGHHTRRCQQQGDGKRRPRGAILSQQQCAGHEEGDAGDEEEDGREHQRTGQDGEGASITVPTPMW